MYRKAYVKQSIVGNIVSEEIQMNKDKKILIVDDIKINRAVLNEIFKEDYTIVEACDGAQAIEIINSGEDISAVLLDLIMPRVNGLGVLEDMNRSGKIKSIPVFLITAISSKEMLMDAYRLGAIDVITKPFMAHFLTCRVNNIVDSNFPHH